MTARLSSLFRSILISGAALLGCALVGGVSVPVKASTALYSITDLGSLGCCAWWVWESSAVGINNAGDVVGATTSPTDPTNTVPFIYRNGTMTAIRDSYGSATGINDAGQATGYVLLPGEPNVHAFLYQDGVFRDLGGLPGYSNQPYSLGYAINNAGTIVGDSNAEAMIYADGTMTGLKRRAARAAYAINDAGDVVGLLEPVAPTPNSNHAFLFSGKTLIDIGSIDGAPGSVTIPTGINSHQQIVGSAWAASTLRQRAFLYQNGVMTDIGTLAGGYSGAAGINNHGHIVGSSDASVFLYRDGVMIDLNQAFDKDALGIWPSIQNVSAINDRGQIVGSASFADEYGNGHLRAFLLTPLTPEQ
jgi:probable HAF family extracellular repeat protein